jgi:hypothetical protein
MSTDNTTPTGTTVPTTLPTVIAQLPPCPSWCTNHPYGSGGELQVHEAMLSEGDWIDSEMPHVGVARGGVRLVMSEAFDFNARTVNRDAAPTIELFEYAPEGSQYRVASYLSIADPRAVAAALLAAADVLDDAAGA